MAVTDRSSLSEYFHAPVTPFIGRREELTEVRRLLSESRFVTLTGVGGVGKTRLALQTANEVQRHYRDGARWIDLAPLDEPMLVAESVQTALGIRAVVDRSPTAVIADYVRDKHMLLIMDNCEQVVGGCVLLVDALLRAAPDLKILTTSRQPLGLPGERIIVVTPFPVPDVAAPDTSLQDLLTNDAVGLFVSRATGVLPSFELSRGNVESVAALCRRVDGLPLAIELAAVKLRAFSVDQVLAHLDERFDLLRGGNPAALPRQKSLYGLIDWSYQLCTPDEQLLWARISVFAGSFDLAAAEVVCRDEDLQGPTLLNALTGLVDKSVLLREEHGSAVRYRLLEIVREYGRTRLTDDAPLRRKHLDHYIGVIGEACASLLTAKGPQYLAYIRLEHPNVRAALSFSLSPRGDPGSGMRLAALQWFAWRELGLLSEGRWWLDRLLDADRAPTLARAQALWANGALAVLLGDVEAAKVALVEGSELAQQLGDSSSQAYAEVFLGQVAQIEGRLDLALPLLEHGVERLRALDDPLGIAVASIRLMNAASAIGDGDRAMRLGAELLDLCSDNSSTLLIPTAHSLLAIEYWRQGDLASTRAEATQAAKQHWLNGDRLGAAIAFEVLAWAAAGSGDAQTAIKLVKGVESVWRSAGAPLFGYPHLIRHHDECVEACREMLGAKGFAATCDDGDRPTLEDLAAEMLDVQPKHPATGDEDWSPLTRREREVAILVSKGMTNKEIANTLVISQRTAESHVENMLVKLGFTSRGKIAAWVAARRS